MNNYAIRHVSLLATFCFGFVIGCIALLLPALLVGMGTWLIADWLKTWLDSWQSIHALTLTIRPLELLNLAPTLVWLERLLGWGWRLPLLVASPVIAIGGHPLD